MNEKDSGRIVEYISRRRWLTYDIKNIISYGCRCFCLRNIKNHENSEEAREHFLFSKAIKKLHKELDIVNLVRTTR
jgi:uncharacterized protein YutD